jgi:hypothetical protein
MGFFDTIKNTFTEVDKRVGGILPGGAPFRGGTQVSTQPNATTTAVTPVASQGFSSIQAQKTPQGSGFNSGSPAGNQKEVIRNANRNQAVDTSFVQQNKEIFRQPTPQRDFKETAFDVLKLGFSSFPGAGALSFLSDRLQTQPQSLQTQLANSRLQGQINAQNLSNSQQKEINDVLNTDFVGKFDPRRLLPGVVFDTTENQLKDRLLQAFLPQGQPQLIETPFAQGGVLQLGQGTREPGIFEQIGGAAKDITPIILIGGAALLASQVIGKK